MDQNWRETISQGKKSVMVWEKIIEGGGGENYGRKKIDGWAA